MSKIIKLEQGIISFDDGSIISSDHDSECCEWHEIDPTGIDLDEVKDLEFDLTIPIENLIEKVNGYGIRIKASNNFPLSVPAYGYNNGYYSDELILMVKSGDKVQTLDISECQEYVD